MGKKDKDVSWSAEATKLVDKYLADPNSGEYGNALSSTPFSL